MTSTAPFDELSPPYSTIVADPPWPYNDSAFSGSGEFYRVSGNDAFLAGYSTMSLDDISALPVGDLAENTRLFMWTTNRYLRQSWGVVESWGFKPQQRVLVWCKSPMRGSPVTTEYILIAKKGKPEPMPYINTTWFQWRRQSHHSAKPDAFIDLVEQWCPGPYVELFCRRPRLGWDSWGYGYESGAA